MLKGFGSEFIIFFRDLLIKKFSNSNFKIYVDCGFDNGLSIDMAAKKIDYIKLRGNSIILKKINKIATKNKVLLNPSFNIVDCRYRKNIKLIINKLYAKKK